MSTKKIAQKKTTTKKPAKPRGVRRDTVEYYADEFTRIAEAAIEASASVANELGLAIGPVPSGMTHLERSLYGQMIGRLFHNVGVMESHAASMKRMAACLTKICEEES